MLIDARILWEKIADKKRYPFNLPAIRRIDKIDLSAQVTILVGENGSGKSTLLEALALTLGCSAEGGSKNFRFSTADTHSELHEYLRVAKDWKPVRDAFFYRAETFYNFSSEMKRLDDEPSGGGKIKAGYGDRELHTLSHGQSVIQLLRHRFRQGGIYLMDEPEAALSPSRQLEAIARISELAEQGAQFILATHSPILMAIPGARLFRIDDDGVNAAEYDDIDHVIIYKKMIFDRQKYARSLVGETRGRI